MHVNSVGWTSALLFAGIPMVLGLLGSLTATRDSDQCRSSGVLLQSLILALVAGATYRLPGLDQRMTALLVTGLLIIHHVWFADSSGNDLPRSETEPQ